MRSARTSGSTLEASESTDTEMTAAGLGRSEPPPPATVRRPPPRTAYHRYHIATAPTPDLRPLPHRFQVRVSRWRLARLLAAEVVRYFGRWDVVLNRPCIYGVFSGPIGGFKPRPQHCVGCLRCTIQHPDVVRILPNPELAAWGDGYFTPRQVETVYYEAASGSVPVKGQGYRGRFGGSGWDGMWTDMSEIVRPTRDGIHGRELISTVVDVGPRLMHLDLAADGSLAAAPPPTLTLQLPLVLDPPPLLLQAAQAPALATVWARAAARLSTLALLPLDLARRAGAAAAGAAASAAAANGSAADAGAAVAAAAAPTSSGASTAAAIASPATTAAPGARGTASAAAPEAPPVVPIVLPGEVGALATLGFRPPLVEIAGWAPEAFAVARRLLPESLLALRLRLGPGWRDTLLAAGAAGVRVFHLEADYHGRAEPAAGAPAAPGGPGHAPAGQGEFVLDALLAANRLLIERGLRDQVTLLVSGGIVAAEHVPKAIIAGADAVAIDTAALVALQCRQLGLGASRQLARFDLPPGFDAAWAVQRLLNLSAAWRDQLLEIMGAMGLREVRRLRGETGRAMFQRDLEAEAFAGIEGFPLREPAPPQVSAVAGTGPAAVEPLPVAAPGRSVPVAAGAGALMANVPPVSRPEDPLPLVAAAIPETEVSRVAAGLAGAP